MNDDIYNTITYLESVYEMIETPERLEDGAVNWAFSQITDYVDEHEIGCEPMCTITVKNNTVETCSYCGKRVKKRWNYCSRCGRKIRREE